MTKAIKESHSIAWGYACFGLIWMGMIIVVVYFVVWCYGISKPMEIIKALQGVLDTIAYLFVMSSVNIIMAVAVWKIISLSQKKQQIILGSAFLFAVAALILLIEAIASWFIKKMPNWYSPFYNVFPAALFTFGYGYYAYSLKKLIRTANNGVETDAK